MVRSLLMRGMVAGLAAGLAAAGFAAVVGEPQLTHAIAFGDQVRRLLGEPADPVVVSRSVQSSLGLLTGMVVYGVSFGGIFAVVFAFAYGRLGRVRARLTAALLAVAGFVGIYLVPTLKYPANPPSVGNPDTIGHRTELYVIMLLLSVAFLVGAFLVGRYLILRGGYRARNAALLVLVAYVVSVGVTIVAMPGISEVPSGFPTGVLWRFRLASLGTQVVLWTTLAVAFGALARRVLEPGTIAPAPPPSSAADLPPTGRGD